MKEYDSDALLGLPSSRRVRNIWLVSRTGFPGPMIAGERKRMREAFHDRSAKRPTVAKVSPPPNIEHHKFEDYLAKPSMQKFLRLLTRRNGDGRCYLEEVFESYDRPDLTLWQRLKFAVPHRAIEVFRTRAGATAASSPTAR